VPGSGASSGLFKYWTGVDIDEVIFLIPDKAPEPVNATAPYPHNFL
jgi:hypothetical protein